MPQATLQIRKISAHPGPVPGANVERSEQVCKLIDTTTCIGCKACEVACLEWNGYAFTEDHPEEALNDLLSSDKSLERADQEAQLKVLLPDLDPKPFDPQVLEEWAAWDYKHGLLEEPLDVQQAFDQSR